MTARPEQGEVVRQWVLRAEEDLRNAEHTLTLREDCPFTTVCFHSQQCVEKYLKALLAQHGIRFTKTHDLVELMGLLPEDAARGLVVTEIGLLSRYAVETRYPGIWDPVDREEAEQAAATAGAVRNIIRKRLAPAALE